MKIAPAALLVLLGLGCNALRSAPPAPAAAGLACSLTAPCSLHEEQAPSENKPAPAAPSAPAPHEPSAIRETDGQVPKDLTVHVEHPTASTLRVGVERRGLLVALRRGQERAAGDGAAHLDATPGGEPIVWETTRLDTLETTRGTIRLDERGSPRVALAEPPAAAAEDAKWGHRCRAHEDGGGGFAVVCRLAPVNLARNLAGDDALAGMTTIQREAASFVRFDLPAQPGRLDAFAASYSDGFKRVVIRAEASLLPGEDRASFALLSTDRAQPPRPVRMKRFPRRPFVRAEVVDPL